MNYFNRYKKVLLYFLLGINFNSCLPWDLPDECTEGLPTLSVNTGTTINATAGGNTASWSLVNSLGSVVLSSSGTNLSFNPTSLASGNYTIKAVGRNSCGFQFDLSQVYVKASQLSVGNDVANVTAGSSVTIPVLVNDVLNGAALQRSSVSAPSIVLQPTKGTVLVNPDGTLVYQANSNASGTDVLRYQVCLANNPSVCGEGEVGITIGNTVNNNLLIGNDATTVTPGSSVTISVLANDLLNGTPLQRISISAPTIVLQPTKGTVVINLDGTLVYRSNSNASGTDVFRYQVCLLSEPSICGVGEVGITISSDLNSVIDIDGNRYNTVTIGNQVWLKENLNVTKFRNGEVIPNIQPNSNWVELRSSAWSRYNNNPDNSNEFKLGLLYNGFAAQDPRGVCPTGWKVPSDADWRILIESLGTNMDAGGKLKEAAGLNSLWNSPNTGATNESGFTALPGGLRRGFGNSWADGNFEWLGYYANFWTRSSAPDGGMYAYIIRYNNLEVNRFTDGVFKTAGYSIRCVKE